jgi:uncharacterized iron-regulated membrane protein
MWRRRKPVGAIGAPPAGIPAAHRPGIIVALLVLALLLPMLAASLLALLVFEHAILRRTNRLARWLGCKDLTVGAV